MQIEGLCFGESRWILDDMFRMKISRLDERISMTVNFNFEYMLDEPFSTLEEVYDWQKIEASKDSIPLKVYTDKMKEKQLMMNNFIEEYGWFLEYFNTQKDVYLELDKLSKNKVCRDVVYGGLGALLVGGSAGAVFGGACSFYTCGPVAVPDGIKFGAAVGAGVGSFIGIGLGYCYSKVGLENARDLMKTDKFVKYINEHKCEEVDNIFKEFLIKNAFLSDCLCPLTKNLYLIPVRAPNNITYDCKAIEKVIEDYNPHEKSIPSDHPFIATGVMQPFSVKDLVLDIEKLEKVITKIEVVVSVELKKLKHHDIIQKNLTEYMDKRSTMLEEASGKIWAINRKNLNLQKISKAEYDDAHRRLEDRFDRNFQKKDLFK